MIGFDVLHGALFSTLQVGLSSWFCLAHLTRREDFAARSLVALTALAALALLDPLKGEALGPRRRVWRSLPPCFPPAWC